MVVSELGASCKRELAMADRWSFCFGAKGCIGSRFCLRGWISPRVWRVGVWSQGLRGTGRWVRSTPARVFRFYWPLPFLPKSKNNKESAALLSPFSSKNCLVCVCIGSCFDVALLVLRFGLQICCGGTIKFVPAMSFGKWIWGCSLTLLQYHTQFSVVLCEIQFNPQFLPLTSYFGFLSPPPCKDAEFHVYWVFNSHI